MVASKMRKGAGLVASALLMQGAAAGRKCCKTVHRDVVVVGGGASGAHAAVWLRDHEYSVIVVEKADQLVSPPSLCSVSLILSIAAESRWRYHC